MWVVYIIDNGTKKYYQPPMSWTIDLKEAYTFITYQAAEAVCSMFWKATIEKYQ